MAKDAHGHGSEKRGMSAAEERQNRSGISWAKHARALFEAQRNPNENRKMTAAEQRKSGAEDAAFHPDSANKAAAETLASGPKSTAVPVHPGASGRSQSFADIHAALGRGFNGGHFAGGLGKFKP